jgi:hypothetical protein
LVSHKKPHLSAGTKQLTQMAQEAVDALQISEDELQEKTLQFFRK